MATFTYTPDWSARQTTKPRIRVVAFGDGYEQRQADGINARNDVWDLTFENRSNSDTAAIVGFLEARNAVEAFDWTPPNEATAIKVVCREWNKTVTRFNLNTVTAQFQRVYEP